jgi:hypothetical protein
MSSRELVVSACLVVHLVLLTITGFQFHLKNPATATLLDRIAADYTRTLGVSQYWTMFTDTRHFERYVKVAFVIQPRGGTPTAPNTVFEEMVLPPFRDDVIKPPLSQDFHRMKAVEAGIDGYRRHGQHEEDLAPITRYLRADFCRRSETPCDRVSRTELWTGTIAAPDGTHSDEADLPNPSRDLAVADYYGAPRLQLRTQEPHRGAELTEPGLVWKLLYVDPPETRAPSAP